MTFFDRVAAHDRLVHGILEHRAESRPDHVILHSEGQDYTYAGMNRAANRAAAGLIRLGLKPGDKLAVMMKSSPTYLSVWFAAAKAGAVEVPINTAYKGEILQHILASAHASMIVCDEEFAPVIAHIAARCPEIKTFVVHHDARGGESAPLPGSVHTLADITTAHAAESDENPGLEVDPAQTACIMFTSGTTGPSKGVIINHPFEVSFALVFNEIVDLGANDVVYNFLPFFHIAGKFQMLGTMLVDGRMILTERFSVEHFWDDVRRHGATVTTGVGGICHMLYAQDERPDDADNPMRMMYAVPNPHDVLDEFKRRFAMELTEGYGSTEANIVVYTRPSEPTPNGSAGRAAPYYEVKIIDENDEDVPPGTAGEIVIRPKHANILMEGYFELPEKSLEAFRNLWFHSGDRGVMDENGYLFFLDRLKDAIRRRGENISSFEVERAINGHADVAETAAIAVPAEVGEDEVKVVVVRNPESALTEEALLRWCVEAMPYFMVPRYIEFATDLPRTPTQKVRKIELREAGITLETWDCEKAGLRITRSGLKEIG